MTKKPTPKTTKITKPKAKTAVSKSTVKRVAKLKAAAPKPVPTPIEREEFISPPVLIPVKPYISTYAERQWNAATQDFLAVAPLEEKKPSHWKKVLVALGVIAAAGVFWYVVQV